MHTTPQQKNTVWFGKASISVYIRIDAIFSGMRISLSVLPLLLAFTSLVRVMLIAGKYIPKHISNATNAKYVTQKF
jgi:hypothetical protein